MTEEIPGFPERFPVRDDGTRSWRYKAVSLTCRASLRGFFGRGLDVEAMSKVGSLHRADCRAAVEGYFSTTRMVAEHVELYQELAGA